jgi:hypothetical protein
VIEHLVDWGGGIAPESQERTARRAVLGAYRELWLSWEWRYFKDDRRINLEADYNTGTVAFDLTGGTYERQLTLSGGTWPTNAAYGRIEISDIGYKVQDRKSSTVVTLTSGACPVADVDAGTSYTWFRNEYPLTDVHRVWAMNDETGYWQHTYVTPDEWLYQERAGRILGRPFMWTLTGGRDFFGGMGIRVSGYPEEAMTMDFIATVQPRRLVVDGVAEIYNSTTGTVTAASGTSITITGNTLTNEVIGSIIRLSRNTRVPTDVEGGNAFIDQRVITAVSASGGNTTLTLDDTIDTDGVTVSTGYCISDPVDLPKELYDLLLRWAEYRYAAMVDRKRLAECDKLLNGRLGARLAAREWDNSVQEPTFARGWTAEGWDVAVASITHSSNWADYLAGS